MSTQEIVPDARAQDSAVAGPARPMAAGRLSGMELLGLSGQVQLAQSLSVFAETLGDLLNVPRREGEALVDYSKRLATAMQALSTTEQALLQARLNQLMQGATLRLLTELMKDPSGPAAARLAAQIATAQYQGEDMAGGHVVSSYQQNDGDETGYRPANANLADGGRGDRAAGAVVAFDHGLEMADGVEDAAGRPSAPASPVMKVDAAAAKPSIEPDGSRAAVIDADFPHNTTFETSAAEDGRLAREVASRPSGIGPGRLPAAADAAAAVPPNPTGPLAEAAEIAEAASEGSLDRQTAGSSEKTAPTEKAAPDAMPATHGDTAPKATGTIYDAAALARRAHAQSLLPSPRSLQTVIDPFVTDWVADLQTAGPDARQSRPATEASAATATGQPASGTGVSEESQIARSRAHPDQSAASEAIAAQPPFQPVPTATSATATLAGQTHTAFEKNLLGMMLVPRVPTPHPLVPVPGAQEFDDSKDHDIQRKSAVGDDGQPSRQGFGGGQSSQGEEPPTQEELPAETVLSQIEAEAPSAPDEMPTEAGPRAAPSRNLSDHPAPSAEDFYRRLASLE